MWATSEQAQLCWIMTNQETICDEVYIGLADTVAANIDASTKSLDQRIILPFSFAESTCHMQQLLQDVLAINHHCKGGNIFLTMTTNPAWPEIQDALQPGQTATDHPDVVIQAFYAKQTQMIKDIKAGIFRKAIAYLFTIELQRCGLPHMHCIIFLDEQSKLHTPE